LFYVGAQCKKAIEDMKRRAQQRKPPETDAKDVAESP